VVAGFSFMGHVPSLSGRGLFSFARLKRVPCGVMSMVPNVVPAVSGADVEFWREKKVTQTLGVSRSTLWAWVKSGAFSSPVQICESGRAVAWPSNEVRAFIAARIAACRQKAA